MKLLISDHHESLRHLTGCIHEIARMLGLELSVSQTLMFLEVARSNAAGHAIDMKELQILIGLTSASTFSRQIAALLDYQKPGVPGLGLLEQRENPLDRRRKQLLLTRKGIKVRNGLAHYIESVQHKEKAGINKTGQVPTLKKPTLKKPTQEEPTQTEPTQTSSTGTQPQQRRGRSKAVSSPEKSR